MADGATITMALTSEGTVLGTPQYMSPEQISGTEADARSDIFAFGCVLYEMVTGKRAFLGKTKASVIGAILAAAPSPMNTGQPVTPAALERLVKRCLVKDPDERYQSMWDVLLELRSVSEPEHAQSASRARAPWVWPAAVAVCFIAAAVFAALWLRRPEPELPSYQFSIDSPPDTLFSGATFGAAVSPDGRLLVFTAGAANQQPLLWLRSLDSPDARPLPRTEGAFQPFWSPDSKSVAFFADSKLKRIDIGDGSLMVLCEAPLTAGQGGGSWSREGMILFNSGVVLHRVPAVGGVAAPVTN